MVVYGYYWAVIRLVQFLVLLVLSYLMHNPISGCLSRKNLFHQAGNPLDSGSAAKRTDLYKLAPCDGQSSHKSDIYIDVPSTQLDQQSNTKLSNCVCVCVWLLVCVCLCVCGLFASQEVIYPELSFVCTAICGIRGAGQMDPTRPDPTQHTRAEHISNNVIIGP